MKEKMNFTFGIITGGSENHRESKTSSEIGSRMLMKYEESGILI
tara:strand:+ start:7124 stop:7255 length:132 start_codon:yes stop_codon:yes gene_type:complete